MDGRGLVESGGAALACALAAAVTVRFVTGSVDWVLAIGAGASAAIAGAANYRARTGHSERVADEAPDVARSDGRE